MDLKEKMYAHMYSWCKENVKLMANNDQKENNIYNARLLWSVQQKVSTSSTCSDEKYCLVLE